MKRRRGFLIIGITLLFLTYCSWNAPGGARREGRGDAPWHGHVVLVVDAAVPCEQVVDRLTKAGLGPVVAECAATVWINGFGQLVEYPLSVISERFDPVDPRIDPYIRGLPLWFRTSMNGAPAAVYYLPAGRSPYGLSRSVAAAMEGVSGEWRLPEWSGRADLIARIGYALLVLLVFGTARGFRWAVFPVAASLFPLVASGEPTGFAAAAVLLPAWSLGCAAALPRLRDGAWQARPVPSIVVRAITPVVVLAAAVLLLQAPPSGLRIWMLAGVILPAGGTAAVVASAVRRYRRCEHRLFVPVALAPGRSPASIPILIPLAIATALAVPVLQTRLPAPSDIVLPRPVAASLESSVLTLASLSSIEPVSEPAGSTHPGSSEHSAAAPPSLADFIAHRAFQEGFMFRRTFDLPMPGETLSVPRFLHNGVNMVETVETVMVYDEEWFTSVLSERPLTSVETILLAQGEPVRVEMRPVGAVYSPPVPLWRFMVLLLLLAVPYALRVGKSHPVRLHALEQRSNRQPA